MRSADGCQRRDTFGHVVIDDHVAGVETAHAVSDDVNPVGSSAFENDFDAVLQGLGPLIDLGGERHTGGEDGVAVVFEMAGEELASGSVAVGEEDKAKAEDETGPVRRSVD